MLLDPLILPINSIPCSSSLFKPTDKFSCVLSVVSSSGNWDNSSSVTWIIISSSIETQLFYKLFLILRDPGRAPMLYPDSGIPMDVLSLKVLIV